MSRTASCEPSASATLIACSTCCPKQARFGRPVRSSCSAWWRFSSDSRRSSMSACLRAVMSRQMPWTPMGRPFSMITRLDTSRTTVCPSLWMNSCSKTVPESSPETLRSVARSGHLEPLRREVALEVRADQLLAGVAEDALERAVHLGDRLVHRDGGDRLVGVLEEIAVALLAGVGRVLGARALDRDSGDVRRELDQLDVVGAAVARVAVVEGERAEQRAVGREDRRRPAGCEPRLERNGAVIGPERIVRDVRDAHALAAVGGGAARPDARADRDAVHRLAVGGRQAGCGAVAQMHSVAVEQEDRREHFLAVLLDELAPGAAGRRAAERRRPRTRAAGPGLPRAPGRACDR